jgi:predicted unusual protein kinase regulating ubiquinone biosynthesis (AarF/ABC1/UbiB family)
MLLAPRYLPRLAALVRLFTSHGLRDLAQRQGLNTLAPDADAEALDESTLDAHEHARGFREELVKMGPAYVKLGQLLSMRPDLLPRPYVEELSTLQSDVPPVPFETVRETIESELGARISKLFGSIDEEPLGAASLGQVHAATMRDGHPVVIKVQRPNIRDRLAEDIQFFREAATFLSDHTSAGQRVDLLGVVQQLERALSDELDYRVEARNAHQLRRMLAEFPHVIVPRVVDGYTTHMVLTTERVRGLPIGTLPDVVRLDWDLRPLADELARAYLKQIAIEGHFHADPHPGNLFLVLPGRANPRTPGEHAARDRRASFRSASSELEQLETDARKNSAPPAPPDEPKIALIDFGMTAHLSDTMREQVVRLLLDVAENRGTAVAEALEEMGEEGSDFERSAFERDIAALLARSYDRSVGEVAAGPLLFELLAASYERGLKLPSELTLLAKTMFNLDGITRSLDPDFKPVGAIRSYLLQIATDRAREGLSAGRIFQAASQAAGLVQSLPHRIDRITQRLAANEFSIQLDTPAMPVLLKGLQKIANRILAGLVLCGLLIASAMLMPYERALGLAGFLTAAAFGFYLVVTILLGDRTK